MTYIAHLLRSIPEDQHQRFLLQVQDVLRQASTKFREACQRGDRSDIGVAAHGLAGVLAAGGKDLGVTEPPGLRKESLPLDAAVLPLILARCDEVLAELDARLAAPDRLHGRD